MSDMNKSVDVVDIEYKELVTEIKKELPNIVLPSMGMFEEVEKININSKDFIVSNKEV